MALIVCHSPKGGTGTTFVAAHLAQGLVAQGAEVTVLTTATFDPLPLHFALPPATRLPSLLAPADQAVVVNGIDLRKMTRAEHEPDFAAMIGDLGFLEAGNERVMIVDVPSGQLGFARSLLEIAQLHLCTLTAAPECLSMIPRLIDGEDGVWGAQSMLVLNRLDETRRLSRHSAAFLRELAGSRLLGRVRLDEAVPEAGAMLQPLDRYAPTSAALTDLVQIAQAVGVRLEAEGVAFDTSAVDTSAVDTRQAAADVRQSAKQSRVA
ncbi:cellulose synthase operon protein YhjQ/BcsQ [Novosphingobium sp. 9]|uniref:cellulose synthase operon protein YhjQ/BcsQ n=1 Tax=Novosphingobium sp. 9 TaxID=2025349 RepID=UPI0021B51193|nr:cellulose synthase operon protein YhjQ/BcsQ [Novosphingobium sp. 9]